MFGHLKTPSFTVLVIAFGLGCSAPKPTPTSEGLVGRPPPPSEDPFYFVAMERAVQVESSGVVEPDPPDFSRERAEIRQKLSELEARELQIREEFERLGRERDQLAESSNSLKASQAAMRRERDELDELRRSLQSARATAVAPDPEKVVPKNLEAPKPVYTEVQCVSCVSICPMIGGQMKCPREEDLVCGWGSHPDQKTASQLALAECNGALRLMEGSKVYGEIGGECPRPSCKP